MVLGVLAVLLVVVVATLWTLDRKIRRKALSRFIVPNMLPKEEKVKQLELASQWEMPDLLEVVPQEERIER